jgi:hypothetical protein
MVYNQFTRWNRIGVVKKIFAGFAAKGDRQNQLRIDVVHLKAYRDAAWWLTLFQRLRRSLITGNVY